MSIGERLKAERGRLGLNQADFAGVAGTTKKSQIGYEKDVVPPDAAYLAAVAAAGVDVQYVITGQRRGDGIGEAAVHQAVLDAVDLLSLEKKVDAQQLARAVVKLCARDQSPPSPPPAAPPPPAPKISVGGAFKGQLIEGGNSGNVVGLVHPGATVTQINTLRHIEKTIAEVRPGEIHISDDQAAKLHALVEKVAETEQRLKQKPRTRQAIWGSLNAHCGVPKYRLIRAEDFAKAQKYLHQWVGRLDSMASAPVKDGDAWRKRKYAFIKGNSKDDADALDRYIAKNFGASSLTELDNDQLDRVYRYVASRKARRA